MKEICLFPQPAWIILLLNFMDMKIKAAFGPCCSHLCFLIFVCRWIMHICIYTHSCRFSQDCYVELDGEVTCRNCPPEFTGRRCERCAPGYQGNPMIPGDTCRPQSQGRCDPRGSYSTEPNPRTGQCDCKVRTVMVGLALVSVHANQENTCRRNFHGTPCNPACTLLKRSLSVFAPRRVTSCPTPPLKGSLDYTL